MTEHYFIVKLTVPTVDFGFGSPRPFAGGTIPPVTDKTYSFTDTALILPISDVFKCVLSVSQTTPKLKAGLGVASRASFSVQFTDIIDDPNTDSPNLVADPTLAKQGSFFPKLIKRQVISNKSTQIEFWKFENNVHTLVKTNNYIATKLKKTGTDRWSLEGKDILYKTDQSKSQFPKIVTGKLTSSISAVETSIPFSGDVADWNNTDFIAVIGDDLLQIVSVAGTSSNVTLTVTRNTTITVGSRTYINEPQSHDDEAEVFRGRLYTDAHLADVIEDIWLDSDIPPSSFDKAAIEAELDAWIPSYKDKVDAIYYEANDAVDELNNICSTFLIDIWADPSDGKLDLRATSPWLTTTAVLTEGREITYGTLKEDSPEKLQFSRAFLLYDKQKLTDSDDDVKYRRSSLAKNTELEGPEFYDETTYKRLSRSLILSSSSESDEIADTNTIRFVQRFSDTPKVYSFETEEEFLTYDLSDVVQLLSDELQDESGAQDTSIRAQVVRITPKDKIGRVYSIEAVSYNPFSGSAGAGDKFIVDSFDVNLFVQAGSPPSSGTFNFIFDLVSFGQNSKPQAIETGSFPSGSIVNIVGLNGVVLTAKGGKGGDGTGQNGFIGGDCLLGKASVTINIYINGLTPDLGNGTYNADGRLHAPGGGGGGGSFFVGPPDESGSGGGGGAGSLVGPGGIRQSPVPGTIPGQNGNAGALITGGNGGNPGASSSEGGDGGNSGNAGTSGDGDSPGTGGAAGKAIILNGGTINIITNGDTGRFIQGNGDAPSSLT